MVPPGPHDASRLSHLNQHTHTHTHTHTQCDQISYAVCFCVNGNEFMDAFMQICVCVCVCESVFMHLVGDPNKAGGLPDHINRDRVVVEEDVALNRDPNALIKHLKGAIIRRLGP